MRWPVALFLLFGLPANAATFRTGVESGVRWVSMEGEIAAHDDATFSRLTANQPKVAVFLSSPGGLVTAGLAIGEMIHEHGYSTAVPPGQTCASVCGAIWLGGAQRFIGSDAKIGFHAASTASRGIVEVSPVANAWLGAYFSHIGLKQKTIAYLVNAAPQDMKWLSLQDANENGIVYTALAGTEELPSKPFQDRFASAAVVSPVPAVPKLSVEEGKSAERLTRRFNIRFKEGGMRSVAESIDACYRAAIDNRKWDSAVYCAALDILAMVTDGKLAEGAKLPRTAQHERPAVVRRSNEVASKLDFDAELLRERASLVALVAASKIDTTEDPAAYVKVSASDDVVVEGRSSSARRTRHQAMSGCATFAAQLGQIGSGLQNVVNNVFCGRGHQ